MGRSKPGMITLNLTDKCNQHCVYCEIGHGSVDTGGERLSYEDLVWIIDQAKDEKIKRISLCGGEPFLFEGITELVSYAGEIGIQCTITSNGMSIHKLSEKDLQTLVQNRTLINISVDSFREEIQNHTRGHEKALSNALLSIRKLQKKGINPTILCVISKYNYDRLYEFIEDAYALNVTQVLLQPVIHETNYPGTKTIDDKSGLNLPPEKLDILYHALKKIQTFEKYHAINTNVYRILPWIGSYIRSAAKMNGSWFWEDVLGRFYCRDVYAIIDITYDGGIQACGLAKSTVNIKERQDESLLSLWQRASAPLKEKLEGGAFESYCNACCHHFSRNMLASIMRYPLSNRRALIYMSGALLKRARKRMIIHKSVKS